MIYIFTPILVFLFLYLIDNRNNIEFKIIKNSDEFGCLIIIAIPIILSIISILYMLLFGDSSNRNSEFFNDKVDTIKGGLIFILLFLLFIVLKIKPNKMKIKEVEKETIKRKNKFSKTRQLNNRQATQQDIDKANAIINRKDQELQKKITLEDFITDFIKSDGYEKAESLYNGLVKIYELSGRDTSQKDEIYNKYFKK